MRELESPLSGIRSPFGVSAGGASAFTPASLTGLAAWYDANVVASITTAGTDVTSWADQSGNSRDLLNTSGSARPSYPSTALNSIDTVGFNNDFIEATGFSIPQPYSYAIVVRSTANSFARSILSTAGGSRSQVAQQNEAAPARFAVHCGTERSISATTNDGTSWYILIGVNHGATSYGGVNAAPTLLAASPGTAGLSGIKLGQDGGGFQPLTGQIAEAIIWANSYDATEMTNTLAYLQTKWAL